MDDLEVTQETLDEVVKLIDDFNQYAKGSTLRGVVNAGAPLVAATLTVERTRVSINLDDALHTIAFGIYLAEIGKAHLVLPQAVIH